MPYLHRVKHSEVIIVGGGLAGLTAALDLANKGKEVLVVEKRAYPNHKVCGEYVSNEVMPYLEQLGVSFDEISIPKINTLQIGTMRGKLVEVQLPLGGFGISRYAFDNLLFETALRKGIQFRFDTVTDIRFANQAFEIELASRSRIGAKVVLGAYGKRSRLDHTLARRNVDDKSPWLGVKCHYKYDHPEHVVALHHFPGGYAGISQVEDGIVNLCYLVKYEHFKKVGTIAQFNSEVLGVNPFLRKFIAKAQPIFQNPLSIAQISFGAKSLVSNHVLMCGDTAGMIHPLCGNGMAMAIHGGKLVVENVERYLNDPNFTRRNMEYGYGEQWKKQFGRRLWMGKRLQGLMLHTKWFNIGMGTVAKSKVVLESVIRSTHGSPIIS